MPPHYTTGREASNKQTSHPNRHYRHSHHTTAGRGEIMKKTAPKFRRHEGI
jgi:hypothetical protein